MIYLPKLGRAKFLADLAGIEGVASIETQTCIPLRGELSAEDPLCMMVLLFIMIICAYCTR